MLRTTILINTVAALVFSATLMQAQETGAISSKDARKKVILGFKGGVNRSNVFDESGGQFVAQPKVGFAGGSFLAVPFGSLLGFQPEIMFTQKGFQGSGVIGGENYLITRTTNHLEIPLQLQVKPFAFFSALAGVQYSYLLSQNDRTTFGANSTEQIQEFQNDNIRKNMFGAVVGFDINIGHMVISGRSGWDLLSNHGDGNSSTPRYKNMWLQGTFGYRLY